MSRRWRFAYRMSTNVPNPSEEGTLMAYEFDHFTVPTGFVLVYVFVNAMVDAYHHKIAFGKFRHV